MGGMRHIPMLDSIQQYPINQSSEPIISSASQIGLRIGPHLAAIDHLETRSRSKAGLGLAIRQYPGMGWIDLQFN